MAVKLVFCHFCEIHGPSVVFSTKSYTTAEYLETLNVIESKMIERDDCEGCSFNLKSLDTSYNGFICEDKSSDSKFISLSQNIVIDEEENNLIRHGCVRSLSCEVCPQGREGFIYFGDDRRGHVLSHTFVLKDSKARGFQRIYSILVMSEDKQSLLANWDFFQKHLQRIIKKLKDRASSVHDEELSLTSNTEKRAIRLNTVSQVGGSSTSRSKGLINTQRSSSKARSLIDLTNNANIFGQLHSDFCWLINASANKIARKPLCDVEVFSECQATPSPSQKTNLRQLYNFLGKDKFRVCAYHTVVGHQIIVRSKSPTSIKSTIKSLSELLPSGCVKPLFESLVYEDVWKCNFLGILDSIVVPHSSLDSEYQLQIHITEKQGTSSVTLHTKAKIPERLPKYVYDLERVLQDTSFSDEVLDKFLIAAKEEWLNKSKMIYAYTKGVQPPKSPTQLSKLYQAINIQESDLRLLQFWMSGGLSLTIRANVVAINSSIPEFGSQINIKNVNNFK